MDLARARFLTSPEGRAALRDLAPAVVGLSLNARVTALRKHLDPSRAGAISEQIELRAKAAKRFESPPPALLSTHGLEMMTHPLVAARRAGRLAAGVALAADLTSGIGGDLASIAATGTPSAGLDLDPAAATLAAANVPAAQVVVGDALRPPFNLESAAVLLDPARRSGSNRRFDPTAFEPPLDACFELAASAHRAAVKAPPGLHHEHIPSAAEAEFVQLARSMREATLWFGEGAVPGLRRAVHLPSGATLDSTAEEASPDPASPGAVIVDPESCVTRAGLVRHLAAKHDARLLDPQIAYLTAETSPRDPLLAAFAVLEVLPFSIARLKNTLRQNHWRPDEIRRRAFPIEPDELRRLLGRHDGDPVALLCTTIAGQRTVFLARRSDRD